MANCSFLEVDYICKIKESSNHSLYVECLCLASEYIQFQFQYQLLQDVLDTNESKRCV